MDRKTMCLPLRSGWGLRSEAPEAAGWPPPPDTSPPGLEEGPAQPTHRVVTGKEAPERGQASQERPGVPGPREKGLRQRLSPALESS